MNYLIFAGKNKTWRGIATTAPVLDLLIMLDPSTLGWGVGVGLGHPYSWSFLLGPRTRRVTFSGWGSSKVILSRELRSLYPVFGAVGRGIGSGGSWAPLLPPWTEWQRPVKTITFHRTTYVLGNFYNKPTGNWSKSIWRNNLVTSNNRRQFSLSKSR